MNYGKKDDVFLDFPPKAYDWPDAIDDFTVADIKRSGYFVDAVNFMWAFLVILVFSCLSFFCGSITEQNRAVDAGVAFWQKNADGWELRFRECKP